MNNALSFYILSLSIDGLQSILKDSDDKKQESHFGGKETGEANYRYC